ncbi:MAG: transposase, partial [Candidatus Cloacimonetes bacterium]|nr:transposase [Candidatus Cloacimonadota bacterium]
MRCPKESFIKDSYFHLYNRTVKPNKLFYKKDDYIWFLKRFKKKIVLYPATVFAYCLMPNHFHFLIRQDSDKPIYKIFNDSLSAYVKHYNYKYKRKGTLFEGHLQHKNVNNEKYLLYLCQYIHFNPKKAGLVDNLEDWKFSNFLEWIGKR